MPKVPYTKPALTFVDQLQQLKNRGLTIEDDNKCLFLLETISYYRLSGYWYPMLEHPKHTHKFKQSSSFNAAFNLYCFDRELRKLINAELEKIEVAIRAKMIYILSHSYGAFWFRDNTLFSNQYNFNKTREKLEIEFERSEEEFIIAFKNKYTDSLPPCWIMFEISSFGNLSSLYKNLKKSIPEKRAVANHFGLDRGTFESWMHSIVYIRNLCAHHSRLWNRELRVTAILPNNPRNQWLNNTAKTNSVTGLVTSINKRIYCTLSIIIYLLNVINPNHNFKSKFKALLHKYPDVDPAAMGFTSTWGQEPLWQ